MSGKSSLASRQRGRVFDAYRGRGHRNSNLWLVYSIKENRDFMLHSDRSLIHWLCYLESDASVASFDVLNEEFCNDIAVEQTRCMLVHCREPRVEIHVVGGERPYAAELHTESAVAKIRHIDSDELEAKAKLAIRWLKALSYVALYRYQDLAPASNQVASLLARSMNGTVNDLAEQLDHLDRAALFAAVVKAAIRGNLKLDLAAKSLCGETQWQTIVR